MKRRNFLRTSGQAALLPFLLNGMPLAAAPRPFQLSANTEENDRVLVLIQLNGGNDGLNMIIPVDQYAALANVRPNILLPQNSLLSITDKVAFHPAMSGMKNMYENGLLSVVQSAGYPDQNRSHFRSTDIWQTGSASDEMLTTGWLGRYLDTQYPGFPDNYPNEEYAHPFAITMGSIVSETCQGTAANFSLTLNDPFNLSQLLEGDDGIVPDNYYGDELEFLRTSIAQTNAYNEVIGEAAQMGNNTIDYPEDNGLANQLRNVALLISGGMQTKIYVVSIGGFDTHANQVVDGDPTQGAHAVLMERLSTAMEAFQNDLIGLGISERVVGMTFSEFGRQIRSNDSFGTDHGTAAPLVLFGDCVDPQILGDNPEIATDVSIGEGVPMQYDFRDIYGSIIQDWFGATEEEVKSLLHQDYVHLPVLQLCSPTSVDPRPGIDDSISLEVAPNPMHNWATIHFTSEAEWVNLSLFDAMGARIRVLLDRRMSAGAHQIRFDAHDLASGVYFYRIQMNGRIKTRRVVKQ